MSISGKERRKRMRENVRAVFVQETIRRSNTQQRDVVYDLRKLGVHAFTIVGVQMHATWCNGDPNEQDHVQMLFLQHEHGYSSRRQCSSSLQESQIMSNMFAT